MERLVEMGEGIWLRLQPWVAVDADRTRDVGPLVCVARRAVNNSDVRVVAMLPEPVGIREEFRASVACGHVLLRRLRVRRVVIRAGLDELPSGVFRKVHAGVDGCRMSHGFLDELLVILRVEMGAIRDRAIDSSHVRSPH
jgi:hypothetical protein